MSSFFWPRSPERGKIARSRAWIVVLVLVLPLLIVGSSQATHLFSDLAGHTSVERVIKPDSTGPGYRNIHSETPGEPYIVRDGAAEGNSAIPNAQAGREQRRRSLTYLGQFTDFQLADEESPARVEFLDPGASSAWRPQEALQPFIIEWSIRQMNLFANASPITQGDGTRAQMDFALATGDQADSAQRNETVWVRELLEGNNPLNFNSGSTDPSDYDPTEHPSCANYPPSNANRQEALRYTGVQDYDDYDESQTPNYYDPDQPLGQYSTWPTYTGLMDRAQQLTITPAGLDVPSYLTNGNHDPLVQGNEDPNEAFEDIAMGCFKMLASTVQPGPGLLDPSVLLAPAAASTLVPPDPDRRYVSKPQIKAIYGQGGDAEAHGYNKVDAAESAASNGSASYYAWDPPEAPGFRYISIDTVSEGGQTAEGVGAGSAAGNIDDPQFQWLKGQLNAAEAADKLIVIFGHHPVRSMNTEVVDEQASPCTTQDSHGDTPEHDRNPGCDLDPRSSAPVHLGQDPQAGDPRESFVELLDNYPHVLTYVAGHTHEHRLVPFTRSDGTAWWEVNTSATADWPTQSRLVEIMDNRDGTLSIFGSVIDAASAAPAPAPGSAAAFDSAQLSSVGRALAANDPQVGISNGGTGVAKDRNAELLVRDPRVRYPRPGGATPLRAPLVPEFNQCTAPNATHTPPLNLPSCTPASLTSSQLTTSTIGKGLAFAQFNVQNGDPGTPADEADVLLTSSATDVRAQAGGGDYAGDVVLTTGMRLTDNANGSNLAQSATVQDFQFSAPIDCVATPDPDTGGTCSLTTTFDTLVPGFARERERMVMSAFSVHLDGAGPDGSLGPPTSCPPFCGTGDETTFLRQGVFTP